MVEFAIHIRNEELAWRLLDIAHREKRSVEEVLEAMLENYAKLTSDYEDNSQSDAD